MSVPVVTTLLEVLKDRPAIMEELKYHEKWGDKSVITLQGLAKMATEDEVYACKVNPDKLFKFKWCCECHPVNALQILSGD